MTASKRQQYEEADLILRAVRGGWKVEKHRSAHVLPEVIDTNRREEIVREVRLAVAPRAPKIMYLTEKEKIHGL